LIKILTTVDLESMKSSQYFLNNDSAHVTNLEDHNIVSPRQFNEPKDARDQSEAQDDDEDEGDDSDSSMEVGLVRLTSQDPRAAARAAAILKQV
jgi:hypothetical protein